MRQNWFLLAAFSLSLASTSPAPAHRAVPHFAPDGVEAGDARPGAEIGVQPAPSVERDVFERVRRSVFLVETEAGHGSGFLVHADGVVMTNDHVIGRSRYVAVGLDPGRKYPAVAIARDAACDIALLRVHPQAVGGLTPLPLVRGPADVAVGDRVLAIGSALTDQGAVLTTGVVSRVAADTIIADINVNPGSSGGPLLDLRGNVLGITTFWQKAAAGPGLGGIVRVHVALPLLAAAIPALATKTAPPYERLPVAPPVPYPADSLREKAAALRDASKYGKTVGKMRVDVLTPPLAYYFAHEAEIRTARKHRGTGQDATLEIESAARGWRALTGQVEAIVGIRARPELATPMGTFADTPFGPPGEMPRRDAPGARFKTDFRQMRLLRGGVEVVPIVPGRFCGPAPSGADPSQPAGCFGLYQYRPEAFAPGAPLELHVYREDAPTRPFIWRLPPALVSRVWADFEPASRP